MRWPCCKLPPRDWGHSFRPASRRPLGICRVTIYDFPPPLGTNRHENDIHAALTRLECNGIPQRPIAFYGSSSFCLWRAMAEDLGSLDVVNLGFGGSTLLSAVYHMDRLLLPLNPVKIVLYFGENDIANDGLTAASTFTHFLALREEIAKWLPEVHVFAMSVKHSPARWPFADEVDRYNGCAPAGATREPIRHGSGQEQA